MKKLFVLLFALPLLVVSCKDNKVETINGNYFMLRGDWAYKSSKIEVQGLETWVKEELEETLAEEMKALKDPILIFANDGRVHFSANLGAEAGESTGTIGQTGRYSINDDVLEITFAYSGVNITVKSKVQVGENDLNIDADITAQLNLLLQQKSTESGVSYGQCTDATVNFVFER
mgnify:CR=1 FL=1